MNKYLALAIETLEGDFKGHLKVELTVDGATFLENNPAATLMDLFGEAGKVDQYFLSADMKLIYTEGQVRYEKEPMVIKRFENPEIESLFKVWQKEKKEAIYFRADESNAERTEEYAAKMGADMWAVYSPQKVHDVAMEIQARQNTLGTANEKLIMALGTLNGMNYNQDENYRVKIQELSKDMEKEMNYNIEKMNLLKIITGNDFTLSDSVAKVYRQFRSVDEVENKKKLNVKTIEDGSEEISPDKAGNVSVSAGEVTGNSGPESIHPG